MLKISDFARIAQVTVKALRHYDELGLLKPAHVDPFTNYRFYSVQQLPRLNRILALKDLGFALEQIAQMLDQQLTSSVLRELLAQRRAELAQHVAEEQGRLARVTARLRQIEHEGHPPEYDVVLKQIPAQRALVASGIVTSHEVVNSLSRSVGELLLRHGLAHAGPWLHIYHDAALPEEQDAIDTGVLLGQAQLQAEDGPTTVRELPGIALAACVVHSDDGTPQLAAYIALGNWIEANGYSISGPCRELYLGAPGQREPITEIQFPVEQHEGGIRGNNS